MEEVNKNRGIIINAVNPESGFHVCKCVNADSGRNNSRCGKTDVLSSEGSRKTKKVSMGDAINDI